MQLNSAIPITLPVATQNIPILSQGNSLYTNNTKNFDKCYFNEENHDGIGSTSNTVFESSHKPLIKEETFDDDIIDSHQLRETVLQHYQDAIESLKCNFRERLQELFFIQSGGNMVDYPAWKIRPNPHLITFLSAFRLDENMSFTTPMATNTTSPSIKMQSGFNSSNLVDDIPGVNLMFSENICNDVKAINNGCLVKSDQFFPNSTYNDFIKNEEISNRDQTIVPKDSLKATNSHQSNSEIIERSEDIAGQVKHESDILDRVSQLRKNGLWSLSRLPKVCEQLRKKSHWDFLLEEMQWLAADFAQEKKWKRNMGRKISRAVLKYHQDQASQNKRAQNEEKVRLRRIASGISKEVRTFWQQIEKVACYKQQSRQEEQRKKALDLHLNFIVDQTERYSSWLVEGMKESTSSPFSSKLSDNEFEPESDVEDDETTIAEEENHNNEKYEDELEALRRESEMPIEDLINAIPENILTQIGQKETSESESDISSSEDESDDYVISEDEEDVEDTLDVEEKYGDSNHKEELEQLQRDSELPINELIRLYGNSNNVDDTNATQSDLDSDSNEDNDIEKEEVPLSALIQDSATENSDDTGVPNKELNDAAATAESLQPKGFTLSTTQVKTNVPFLLKHSLREYQHIGLDWLVTMYSKQLNGILADEMGLGKTIQTIALLAHLACEEGCWGPHLIIVPTSVMLNWELELKKWCPGFKILTYFGTQKERKIKRAGWCKPNAFHVCITSYKLVIQDHQAFKRRKWKYIILDEAQNIKNFKSQRWQTLLNFNSHRRLLLTGTPLQNSLMELWSLMHFLMPNIFESHQDFKEWFSNPLTGMIEGSREYSEGIIKRLHTVLRPFLLRRLKSEVELQMPKKYEHVIMCRLSKRQRFLYDEFMARTKTKETIAAGNFLSVINILMQLRKVCNHPDLFELRPTVSPFVMEQVNYSSASLVDKVLIKDPLEFIDINSWNFNLIDLEINLGVYQARRTSELKVPKKLIEDVTPASVTSNSLTENTNPLSTIIDEVCVSSLLNNHDSSRLSNTINLIETNRSYLDIIDFSQTTAGCASIGDILTRQVEESLDAYDVDIVNIDNDSYSDIYYSPAAKKRRVETTTNKKKSFEDYVTDSDSPFYLEHIKQKADSMLASRLKCLAQINERHCSSYPLYGVDLRAKLNILETGKVFYPPNGVHCECETLKHMIKSPKKRIKELQLIIERFALFVHPVLSSPIQHHICNPAPSKVQHVKNLINDVTLSVGNKFSLIYPLKTMSLIQFPETRLVQYDCGKLQALNDLLRHLKIGKHRVLIFTQMTKMLDVLERFLNHHGYIYLRLDGTTKVEQRQILMERFNQDNKIFIFILSTRSGGIGINLTGADTVVFYDSDWNPTMDAQAQDRCHRIGQTRDVHIYRLISERTVEENILKKAQQKRLLGNIAIEGGNFNTAFFKQESVQELFNTNSANTFESFQLPNKKEITSDLSVDAIQTNSSYEQVLGAAEEEEDAVAAQKAKAEQELEMVEFTDNVNNEGNEKGSSGLSKVEKDLLELESQLRPIELLALKFVESTEMYTVNDEVIETEKKLEQAKKDWELDHLRSIKEAEEQRYAEQEDEMLFTYVRDSTYSKEYIDDYTGSPMPMWVPPTPPEDNHIEEVLDPCLSFLYEAETIPENYLPPTHFLKKNGTDLYSVKRNTSRTHYLGCFKKKRNRITKPRSIFDKKALELLSSKSKFKKSQKLKQKAMASAPSSSVSRPDYSQRGPDWLINEDWTLLQTVNILSELPVGTTSEIIQSRSVNWELAADLVNCTNNLYRSSRQCRDRYQNVIVPREEGKLMIANEMNEQKQKKNKKLSPPVPLPKVPPTLQPQPKTYPQFTSDNGKSVFGMHYNRFDQIKKATLKRKPVIKQSTRTIQSFISNGVLSVEKPLNPKDLASMRAERIAKEKARVLAAQQVQLSQTAMTSIPSQGSIALTTRTTQTSVSTVGHLVKVTAVGVASNSGSIRGNLVFTSTSLVGGSTLIVPTVVSSASVLLNTTPTSYATISCKMQNLNQNTVSIGQLTPSSVGTAARILTSGHQSVSGISVSKIQTVATIPSSIMAPTLVAQVQRGTAIATSVGTPALITTQPFIQGKALTQQQLAILRQKAQQQQQQQQQQLLKIQQQQRLQQQSKQQLKLIQQQLQPQAQVSKQLTVVASGIQPEDTVSGIVTVQTMKAATDIRGPVPQQIVTQTLTAAQQQQLLQQALKKQQLQQLQQRGQLASSSQIQQMLAGQKLTQQQLQQLQQQQRHTQLQQQLKFQPQQVTTAMVSQTKAQIVMTQVKQAGSPQSLKSSGQQIQLHQLPQGTTVQASLSQQILLRPTLTQASGQFQGLPQQIQLRAMINQQSNQQRIGQQLQTMQAQVNLQTGNVVMPSQQPNNIVSQQQLNVASQQQQLIVASSLAQQQQLNIQAAVQKQVMQQQQQQQQQLKAVVTTQAATSKSPQIQLHLQPGNHMSPQLQRQQVLSATPAQLSQVKAFVSQAQLQASQSRSNSPVSSAASPSTGTTIQLQAQQVGQQMRRQAQLVQVQVKPPVVESIVVPQQVSPKEVSAIENQTLVETVPVEKDAYEVKATDSIVTAVEDKVDEHTLGMRTRTRSQHK